MTELLELSPDELLTTTRAVRKRLDLERPVPMAVIREALEVAIQAPNGGNLQFWQWIVLTDPALKQQVAEFYRRSYGAYASPGAAQGTGSAARIAASSDHLAEILDRVPVIVIAAMKLRGDIPPGSQAGWWGSLFPACWSFALALRARGLGTTWTTLHLAYEREVAELLGIPDNVHQGVLFPVAYTKGTDFKSAPRRDLDAVLHVNGW